MKKMKLFIILIAVIGFAQPCTAEVINRWIEADSAQAVEGRIRRDFPYTMEEGLKLLQESDPSLGMDDMYKFAHNKLIETKIIDGVERMYRKSPRNLPLLMVDRDGSRVLRGASSSDKRRAYADSVVRVSRGELSRGNSHKIKYIMCIDVPYIDDLEGDTLRVWMPVPRNTWRQERLSVVPNTEGGVIYGDDDESYHTGIYLEQPVRKGEDSHFEIEVEYVAKGVYFDPDSIIRHIQPYKNDENYHRYTRMETPHIIDMSEMAKSIVGDESNPFRQSEMVYDYIVTHYPWAGAREYSTIECIPAYVAERGYGDCGQVALLYISLMRSLGVPARWESGWMLVPGEVGIHDWAEVYFEGVGWVPVDVSFGRYANASDQSVRNFYSTGIDAYRMAANSGVCGQFGVPKRYIRSETVDQQVGEVESSRGNLFYPLWDYGLKVISIENY